MSNLITEINSDISERFQIIFKFASKLTGGFIKHDRNQHLSTLHIIFDNANGHGSLFLRSALLHFLEYHFHHPTGTSNFTHEQLNTQAT